MYTLFLVITVLSITLFGLRKTLGAYFKIALWMTVMILPFIIWILSHDYIQSLPWEVKMTLGLTPWVGLSVFALYRLIPRPKMKGCVPYVG